MQALHGIRVIDVSRVVAGPFCTYQLALMGADVIKIEEPGKGDPVRWSASGTDSRFRDIGMATTFLPQNSNKRSITLDLRKEEGKAIFRQLVQGADVVVENFRAGVMDGLGLGYNALLEINPKLIFCSLTGYGQHQPKGQHRAYDGLIQAASGMMTMVGTKDTGPLKVGPVIVDYTTGLVGAYAIGMALLQRHQTGKGQYIDVSMLNTALTMMSAIIVDYKCTGHEPSLEAQRTATRSATSGYYETADGKLAITAIEDHQAKRLMITLGIGHLLGDPRFADPEERMQHRSELTAEISKVLATRTSEEWEDILSDAGVPCSLIRTIPEILNHPQVAGHGLLHTFPNLESTRSDVTVVGAAFKFEHDGPAVTSPPPTVGQHADEVLKELGYNSEQIEALRGNGVI